MADCPGETDWFVDPGKAPVILRDGKEVRPKLKLLGGHQVMNWDTYE